jgi:5-methylcytosine-specific restriction protein A
MAKNPTWSRDELILALDLYLRHRERLPDSDDAEIVELSRTLNSLFGEQAKDSSLFRNPNGVYMKLANFRAVDPLHTSQGKRGLSEAEEGSLLTRIHRVRERNRELVRRKRDAVLRETGRLACEACDFDFNDTYGEHGRGFIEVHHLLPLHVLKPGTRTRMQDLAVLCANCHRMVHAKTKWLTLTQMKELLAERARTSTREMHPAQ